LSDIWLGFSYACEGLDWCREAATSPAALRPVARSADIGRCYA